MNFGVLAYGAATVAFMLLAALLIAGRHHHKRVGLFIGAAGLTAIWAGLLALQANTPSLALALVFPVEVARTGIWLAVLTVLGKASIPRWLVLSSNLLWATLLVILVLPVVVSYEGDLTAAFTRGALVMSVVGLVLLEQLYRNAASISRPSLKFLLLGVGGLFVYDVYLYSQAELLQGIERDTWYVRGLANALCMPFIILAIRRSPEAGFSLFVSRHVVLHTTAILGVGGYLLLMALGGYYVRMMGGSWGGVAEIVFMIAALAFLVILVFSGQLRRRVAVFIAKHFYRNKYDYRIEWLRFIQTLSANTEGEVKRTAIRAVSQIFDSPGGILMTTDEQGRVFSATAAWPMTLESLPGLTGLNADNDLIRFLARRRWILDLEEYRRAPDRYENIVIPDWIMALPSLRIISPMMELDRLMGVFLLYSPPPPFSLTYEDRDLLKMVGQHVATQIGQHEADRKLAESRQFETYNKLTAFMMHDLKNCAAQLQLLLVNAERHKSNPAFVEDAFSTIENATGRMTHLIDHLERKDGTSTVERVHLDVLVEQAVRRCSDRRPLPVARSLDRTAVVGADSARLEAILEHVVRNAQDASGPDDSVEISLTASETEAVVTVSDKGGGMTPTFVRERLFRPFDSTKGSKGMGIGAYQTREYVRMLGGDVKVQSSPGNGTTFSIILPCMQGVNPEDQGSGT